MTRNTFSKTMFAAVASVMISLPAWALDLDQARNAGMVGEQTSGYVVALKNTPEVNALVAGVNAKRKQQYISLSKENGQPVEVVAKLFAAQIINKLPAGALYQMPNGEWKKR